MRNLEALTSGNPIYSVLFLDEKQDRWSAFQKTFSADYHVHTASSGKEGRKILAAQTIQLVIAHVKLADGSGLDFLEEVMRDHPLATRMVLGTPDFMDEIREAAVRGIIFRYLEFPWKTEELKISMEGAMEFYYLKSQNRSLEQYLGEIRDTLEMKVLDRTTEIEQQKEKITDSIRYASRIQNAMMPSREELNHVLPPHFLFYKPKDIVSGDFYWVMHLGERLAIAVVDCTGHGVAGAFMSILGISLLNEIVGKLKEIRTDHILNVLRREVIRALGQTGRSDEAKEGMDISLCIIDFKRRNLEYSGAHHPIYLVRNGEFKEIRGDRMPIGYSQEEADSFSRQLLAFDEGDLLYLFSDGYVDQMGGLQRKTFRSVNFKKLIREIWNRPLDEQFHILREEHEIWRAGQEQIDDITVLGLQLLSDSK